MTAAQKWATLALALVAASGGLAGAVASVVIYRRAKDRR
jgi:hypothetical protein